MPAKDAPWDEIPWTPECQEQAINEVMSRVTNKQGVVWIMWTPASKIGAFQEVFTQKKWHVQGEWIWHKVGQNYHGPTHDFIRAYEICLIATSSNSRSTHFSGMSDPLLRHNVVDFPSVSVLSVTGTGRAINPCEKPVQLAEHLIAAYTQPSQNVLVIGSGSGSECIAALNMNRKCWAVESDKEQWNASSARIRNFCTGKISGKECGGDPAFLHIATRLGTRLEKKKKTKRLTPSPTTATLSEAAFLQPSQSFPFESSQASTTEPVVQLVPNYCVTCGKGSADVPLRQCDHCNILIHGPDPSREGEISPLGCGVKCRRCDLPHVCPVCEHNPRALHPDEINDP